jgi:pyridoxine 5-phosphate synthase
MSGSRRLVVRLDDTALLRQAHGSAEPDPVAVATLALIAGADGVAVHLREDRMHVQDRDARILRQTVRHGFRMDIGPLPEMLKVALEVRPDTVVLVPELPGELRTEGGLDLQSELAGLGEMVRALGDGKIAAGVRIAPDLEQVKAAHRAGVSSVQLCTARYTEDGPDRARELERLRDSARLAGRLGLDVCAGGGLDTRNLRPLLPIEELSGFCVGRALSARALLVGVERAVRELRDLVG